MSILSKHSAGLAMLVFVLLWGSAAIFTRWGLNHSSVAILLIGRYAVALIVLSIIALKTRQWLPDQGTRWQVLRAGFLLVGGYSIAYFEAMAHGITPGLLATLLGTQPILTLLITERRFSAWRLAGLLLALFGLILIVGKGLSLAGMDLWAWVFSFIALACITLGTLLQKKIKQAPQQVLPLQFLLTLLMCLALLPQTTVPTDFSFGYWMPVLWLGVVISVVAQLLLYKLIQGGNVVNITSLFYLVPIVTAILDFLVWGHAMSLTEILGMAAIVLGIVLVFKPSK